MAEGGVGVIREVVAAIDSSFLVRPAIAAWRPLLPAARFPRLRGGCFQRLLALCGARTRFHGSECFFNVLAQVSRQPGFSEQGLECGYV